MMIRQNAAYLRLAKIIVLLQTTALNIVDYDVCKVIMSGIRASPLHPTMVCVGSLYGLDGVCSGDSGGPLVQVNADDELEVVGVASWVPFLPCGSPNSPSVYAKTSLFTDWINNKLEEFK